MGAISAVHTTSIGYVGKIRSQGRCNFCWLLAAFRFSHRAGALFFLESCSKAEKRGLLTRREAIPEKIIHIHIYVLQPPLYRSLSAFPAPILLVFLNLFPACSQCLKMVWGVSCVLGAIKMFNIQEETGGSHFVWNIKSN